MDFSSSESQSAAQQLATATTSVMASSGRRRRHLPDSDDSSSASAANSRFISESTLHVGHHRNRFSHRGRQVTVGLRDESKTISFVPAAVGVDFCRVGQEPSVSGSSCRFCAFA